MCGPGFCSMRITEDVRKLADEEGQPVDIEKAMQEKSEEFKKQGAEIYT
jgi:phosphomethylpyrimidine synthase